MISHRTKFHRNIPPSQVLNLAGIAERIFSPSRVQRLPAFPLRGDYTARNPAGT